MYSICGRMCCVALAMAMAMFASSGAKAAAVANNILVQLDDLTDSIVADSFQNGVNIQHFVFGGESISNASYLLWNGATLSANVNVAYNIFDTNGVTLSDTLSVAGTQGSTTVLVNFFSDVEGGPALTPLVGTNVLSVIETGDWQTALQFTTSNGDFYTWQFRSDVAETPLPGAMWLFGTVLVGVAGVGKWRGKPNDKTTLAAI